MDIPNKVQQAIVEHHDIREQNTLNGNVYRKVTQNPELNVTTGFETVTISTGDGKPIVNNEKCARFETEVKEIEYLSDDSELRIVEVRIYD